MIMMILWKMGWIVFLIIWVRKCLIYFDVVVDLVVGVFVDVVVVVVVLLNVLGC